MNRALRNLSVNVAVIVALLLFLLAIVSNVLMSRLAEQAMDDTLTTLERINVEQLNELNRADALWSGALVELEVASNQFLLGRNREATARLEAAEDQLSRAEARFNNFASVPRTDVGDALGSEIETVFEAVFDLTYQQIEALDQMDTTGFNAIRDELAPTAERQEELLTEFVRYAGERGDALQRELDDINQFYSFIEWIIFAVTLLLLFLIYAGLRSVVIRPLKEAVQMLDTIADADLTTAIPSGGKNEIGQLYTAMQRMQGSLNDIVARVRDGSREIHHGTREIASGNADLSSRTEQQAASIEETASSMEEMTATVKQNADNARQASTLAADASSTAERGGDVVQQVVTTMHGISSSSQKVSDITSVIDSIAFQTNILALNASVEAARAGEQGRGFAVVAGEVRNLASRSADAAKEIKALIDDSVTQIQQGSTLVEQAGTTMSDVVTSVRRVTDIMDEISAASQEQSDGIEQVSQAVGQMDQVTQQNASLVQQATAAASSLEEQANRLEEAVAVFKLVGMQVAHQQPSRQASAGSVPKAVAAPAAKTPSTPPSRSVPSTSGHDDWEEF
ncbi:MULTISPECIES: methyl-accepting chemotaxis protein [unclassified Halomonas]|jgi:methyl-accepting chemotaxis protein-2 (aspartate sensor receptor)|uniref:methyl-accepting chemotaxis protein n=1 Tax=unclassified Halomonas TaxID=2609666 RepID=UPI0018EF8471|nr:MULTISPECIES: methyl-accepting chemotaxis protein [unclassified Halomonas]MCO7247787.1 methyl-accepting chemotaxis protein [Halomonas sp. Mc5H-6]QPL46343.1 HAMP domain-containing protein [Halomonas sp. A40-4]